MKITKIVDPENLGKLVRSKRKLQKLTQQQLAGASGTGIRFIIDLEQGKSTCQIGKVLQVLEMLGISIIVQPRNKA